MPVALLALMFAALSVAFGQDKPQPKRYALVVGNSAYAKLPAVPSATSDVEAIAAALKAADFNVTVVTGMTMPGFALTTEQEYLKKFQPGDISFFYYSGYSASVTDSEINFLLPVNFDPKSGDEMLGRAYPLVRLQQELKKRNAGLKMFVLEGPRELDSPVVGASVRLLNPQLGESPETLFAFAAQPDKTAIQGQSGSAGLFTQLLAEQIGKSGRVREVFDNVKQGVGQKTSEQQIPFVNDNIVNFASFHFHEPTVQKEGPRTGVPFQNRKDREEYVWIPAGKFKMGCVPKSPKCEANERPQHEVTLSKGFWMGRNEVQVSSYQHYVALSDKRVKMPKDPEENRKWQSTSYPMTNLSWEEAGAYCKWAGGRLPTEAEWEYAARGGAEDKIFPMDTDEDSRNKANFYGKKGNDTFEYLAPVKSFDPNAFGLFDMAGNVWEWVGDYYSPAYAAAPSVDPKGPADGKDHVVRGGSFNSDPKEHLRISFRRQNNKSADNIGMRCVLEDTPDTRKLLNAP